MDDDDIEFEQFSCKPGEADSKETEHIRLYKPIYNIAKTGRIFKCRLCK